MKKRLLYVLCALVLALTGCAPAQGGTGSENEGTLTIVATTYPIYLFASAVTQGVEGVTVERLNTGEANCLHDYTLSVSDMKLLARADVVAMNGVELEEFMEDALATSDAAVIDCSEGVELLENLGHHHEEEEEDEAGHDHGHFDPHYWMDPTNVGIMLDNLAAGLAQVDPERAKTYADYATGAYDLVERYLLYEYRVSDWPELACRQLITFHDGFQYFAKAFDLELLASIEEEAGSEASAHEIVEISELVKEKHIPAIFTEVNGSEATAKAISRETGCRVAQLSMLMSGGDVKEEWGMEEIMEYLYITPMRVNLDTVMEAFA